MISSAYEKEYAELRETAPDLEKYLATVSEKTATLEQFIAKIRRITSLTAFRPKNRR